MSKEIQGSRVTTFQLEILSNQRKNDKRNNSRSVRNLRFVRNFELRNLILSKKFNRIDQSEAKEGIKQEILSLEQEAEYQLIFEELTSIDRNCSIFGLH